MRVRVQRQRRIAKQAASIRARDTGLEIVQRLARAVDDAPEQSRSDAQ